MKLYVYDHCPFCTKARMIFGLKSLPLELNFLLEDDIDTPTKLVGKKSTPILEKEDGSHMIESMDIVHYVDERYGKPFFAGAAQDSTINAWHDIAWNTILKLSIPRLSSAELPEFATPQARAAFKTRQTRNFGSFDELLSSTPMLLLDLQEKLQALDNLLAGRKHIDADDFVLYPSLRMLSIVKGVNYPSNVLHYMQRMEQSTGVGLHLSQAC